MEHVQDIILNRQIPDEIEEILSDIKIEEPRRDTRSMSKRESKINKNTKDKEKKKPVEQVKTTFEIKLSGNEILAGK